jgi:hypothetical protein
VNLQNYEETQPNNIFVVYNIRIGITQQVGNMIQVTPMEIPNGSFTISASVEVMQNNDKVRKKAYIFLI